MEHFDSLPILHLHLSLLCYVFGARASSILRDLCHISEKMYNVGLVSVLCLLLCARQGGH